MKSVRSSGGAVVVLVVLMVVLSLAGEAEGRGWRGRRRAAHAGRFWPRHGYRRPQRDRGYGQHRPGGRQWWDSVLRISDPTWGDQWSRLHYGGFLFGSGLVGASQPFPWTRHFRPGGGAQWWEGPNVCKREEKDAKKGKDGEGGGESILHHSPTSTQVCEVTSNVYKCTTRIQSAEGEVTKVELHECCHGYSRKPQDFGCPEKLQLKDLPTTAASLGLNDFLAALRSLGLEEEIASANFTVFAPKDGAFPSSWHLRSAPAVKPGISLSRDQPRDLRRWRPLRDDPRDFTVFGPLPGVPRDFRPFWPLRDDPRELEAWRPVRDEKAEEEEEVESVVLGHVVPESRTLASFSDEDVVESGSPVDSTLRINLYSRPRPLVTANCVKVTSTDHMASNGVIHVVEKLLPTVTSSLLDLVQQDKQFSFLKTALAKANLVSTLQQEGQLTLMAPTNSAFNRLPKGLRDKLLSGDPQCLEKVVKYHVLSNVICSTVIQGKAKSLNLLKSYLNLTRTEDGKLFINDAQVVRSDVMGTNGVMHVIDAVLIPEDALDVITVAKKNGLTEFVQLTEAAGMTSTLQNTSDVTVFVPSNEAIQALTPEARKKLRSDPELLQGVLQYHVVPQTFTCRHLYTSTLLRTLHPSARLHANHYSSFPFGKQRVMTVQCAPITVRNVPSCNGLLHVIERVLLPPEGNVLDVLAADSDYSTLVRLLKVSGLADSLQQQGPFTIFAPTNQAFRQVDKATLTELEADREQLASLLNSHIVQGHLCCSGIFPSTWWHIQTVQSQSGHALSLSRDRRGRPLVSDAVIGSCDNTATNGVVHGIDYVLLPRRRNPSFMFR